MAGWICRTADGGRRTAGGGPRTADRGRRAAIVRRPPTAVPAAKPPLLVPVRARLHLLLEILHHAGLAQRRHVAELVPLGDVAQQPAHDLAGARLRQVGGPDQLLGPRELADLLGDVLADLLLELV